MKFIEIGVALGITASAAYKANRRAVSKLGNPHLPGGQDSKSQRIENRYPEKAAKVVDRLTDSNQTNVAKVAKECGFSAGTVSALSDRLDSEYLPVKQEVERIKTDTLVRKFEKLAYNAVNSITMEDLLKLNAYQRTLVAAIATDKRELLDGRPTERISVEDRRALPEMLKALEKEVRRRGMLRDHNPVSGVVKLIDDPYAPHRDVREGKLTRDSRLDIIVDQP